ncbi:MAG: signal peptidase I [Dehalococcoidales bacterium]|nr:signal peptidase I [Dehalococcoidales bacterium]
MKIFTWIISILLGLVIAGLAFIYFSPKYDMYLVKSESMTPTINMGDLILIGPPDGLFSNGIGPGTIITFRYGNELVTHRIVSLQDGSYITKGDATEEPDSTPVESSQIVGTYIFKVPKLGYLVDFMHTKIGWYVVVIVPAIIFLGLIFKEIVKEVLHKTTV